MNEGKIILILSVFVIMSQFSCFTFQVSRPKERLRKPI